MSEGTASAVERAQAYGVDISLLIESLRLTPTERLRRAEAFARFAWELLEQGRRAREGKHQDAADAVRETPDSPA